MPSNDTPSMNGIFAKHLMIGLVALSSLAACGEAAEPSSESQDAFSKAIPAASSATSFETLDVAREQMDGDVYHYSVLVSVGASPNARLRLHRVVRERAPWQPRATKAAVMLLHGDFASFTTNFAPSRVSAAAPPSRDLAVYLAGRGIDVWGLDRRWATVAAPAQTTDLADFADMGFDSAIHDTERALSFAWWIRGLSGDGWNKLILSGFSSGGHIAYRYAAYESQKPSPQRRVKGLVPIDIYARIAPEDDAIRQDACARRDEERAALADGIYESDNGFFQALGSLATTAPDEPSPLFKGYDNRGAMLAFVAQTYLLYPATPLYHLASGVLDNDAAVGLRESPEGLIADWLVNAPPYQAMAELVDGDALWCGDEPSPLIDHLADIDIPILYLGAAGGFGDHGLYSTTQVASTDVSTVVVRRFEAAREAEDFGHADLLFAADATALSFGPMADWILQH